MADTEVEIRIGLPLPMDVIATITKAFAVLWPGGHLDAKRGTPYEMVAVINTDDRLSSTAKRALAKAKVTTEDPKMEGLLAQFDEDGTGMSFPEYTRLRLAEILVAILENEDAPNYLEIPVTAPDGRRYAVAACRSPKQTPHALRMQAEQERDAALAEVARLRAELAEARNG